MGIADRRRGVVLVLALLSLILLAALVFYVFNTGRHVAQRIETQNAADNAAISGAGWVARSFNTVAMNNVEMARLIPLAGILDAVPQCVEYTLDDQRAVLFAVERQIEEGYGSGDDGQWLGPAMTSVVRPNIASQIELLTPLDELFNGGGYNVAAMTFYKDAGGQRGGIWRAIESLSELNVATMENLGLLAQFNAYRGAQINQREGGKSAGGLLLPWVPEVPWTQGTFEDFESMVAEGRLPPEQDDEVTNRGPLDTVLGARRRGELDNEQYLPLGSDVRHRSGGGIPPPRENALDRADVLSYRIDGFYTILLDQIRVLSEPRGGDSDGRQRRTLGNFSTAPSPTIVIDSEAPLAPSQWSRRIQFIAGQKISNVFPRAATTGRQAIDPVWIQDYPTAQAYQTTPGNQLGLGMWVSLEFRRVRQAGGGFSDEEFVAWGIKVEGGGAAIAPPPPWQQIEEYIWKLEVPATSPTMAPGDEQFLYYDVWVGLNVGSAAVVRNPYNFTVEERNALPGPVNFTVDEFGPEENYRRDNLTFLGVAHQPKEAAFMPDAFDGERTDDRYVALAQAEVFNNHSWDLWTQMWHAQLVRVDDYAGWMDVMEDPQRTDEMPWLDLGDVTDVAEYLRAVQPLADLMVEH